MTRLLASGFGLSDWAVVLAYFALLACTGWYFSRRKQRDTDDYFLASRQMPFWAVAISILATSQSAATFLGAPEQAYVGDLTYLVANIGGIIAAVVLALYFIPAYYRLNVATPYGMLERRFGPGSSLAASWTFMIGRVFASGARLYLAAFALSYVIFVEDSGPAQISLCVAMIAFVGVAYTLLGGIRSVIWSDVIQATVYIGAALVAALILLDRIPIGLTDVFREMNEAGKLRVIDTGLDRDHALGIDFGKTFTLLTAVTGFVLLHLGPYGTDHDLVQRMLTCKSAAKGSLSIITSTLVGIPVVFLFLLLGVLLWVFYDRPDLMGASTPAVGPDDSRQTFLSFIVREMPAGLSGLMMAGLFAAGLSSLNSALNAMSSSFINDFYKRIHPNREERHYVYMGRVWVVRWGLIVGAFAAFCIFWQEWSKRSGGDDSFLTFALGVMVPAYAGLLGVFLTALFTRRGSTRSAIAALVTGFVLALLIRPEIYESVASTLTGMRPDDESPHPIFFIDLAFPWQLCIATAGATAVCLVSSGKRNSIDGG